MRRLGFGALHFKIHKIIIIYNLERAISTFYLAIDRIGVASRTTRNRLLNLAVSRGVSQ
jgi:hypothetical protein